MAKGVPVRARPVWWMCWRDDDDENDAVLIFEIDAGNDFVFLF